MNIFNRSGKRPTDRRSRRRYSLASVERLEERQMLSVVSWKSDGDGSWNDPTKWSTGAVPTSGDDVVIDRPGANPTVTFTGDGLIEPYHSLIVHDRLAMASGNLRISADSRIDGSFNFSGGSIAVGPGTLTLAAPTSWTGGTIYGNISNTSTITAAGTTGSNVIASGAMLVNTGTIAIEGANLLDFGDPQIGNAGGTLDNRAGGVVDMQGSSHLSGSNGGGKFINAGILRKSAGTTSVIRNSAGVFDNAGGTIDVETGVLVIGTGGTMTGAGGTFAVAPAAELALSGEMTLSGNYTGSGGGTVVWCDGNLTASNATFNFPAGMFQWLQGTLYGSLTNAGTSPSPTRRSNIHRARGHARQHRHDRNRRRRPPQFRRP